MKHVLFEGTTRMLEKTGAGACDLCRPLCQIARDAAEGNGIFVEDDMDNHESNAALGSFCAV